MAQRRGRRRAGTTFITWTKNNTEYKSLIEALHQRGEEITDDILEEVTDAVYQDLKGNTPTDSGILRNKQLNWRWIDDREYKATEVWGGPFVNNNTYHAFYYILRGHPDRRAKIAHAIKAGREALEGFDI